MDGLKKTIDAVRAEGMEPLGVYANTPQAQAAKGYTIRTVKGIKIAFVAFTKGMDGMALPAGNEGCVNILYEDYATDYQTVNTDAINRVLDAAAKEKPDVTVALLHWGSEYNDNVSDSQEDILKLLKGKGVDAVIGTHSHYVQKMQMDKENGTFVAYSLGDFAGDAERSGSEYSVVLELEITRNEETGETAITDFGYTPIFTVVEEGKPLRVVRIKEAMEAYEGDYIEKISQKTYEAMTYALQRIEARINAE
jgi:poly-gamma-glutamate synthesis protein (capsule biosynthesis protein)